MLKVVLEIFFQFVDCDFRGMRFQMFVHLQQTTHKIHLKRASFKGGTGTGAAFLGFRVSCVLSGKDRPCNFQF